MKRHKFSILLILSLTTCALFLPLSKAAKPAAASAFEEKIATGLARLGIDDSSEIVVAENPDLVERTAADVLRTFLRRGGCELRIVPESRATANKRFLLGRDTNLVAVHRLGDRGDLRIRDVSAEDDGFHLKRVGADIVIAGANPATHARASRLGR